MGHERTMVPLFVYLQNGQRGIELLALRELEGDLFLGHNRPSHKLDRSVLSIPYQPNKLLNFDLGLLTTSLFETSKLPYGLNLLGNPKALPGLHFNVRLVHIPRTHPA